jgi:hypothetical protein
MFKTGYWHFLAWDSLILTFGFVSYFGFQRDHLPATLTIFFPASWDKEIEDEVDRRLR